MRELWPLRRPMTTPLRALLRVALILFLITPAFAQYQAQEGNQGITSYVTFQGSESAQGQVMKLDPSLGYNFISHFGMIFGVPMYFVRTPATTTSPSTSNDGLGNAYVDLQLTYLHPAVNFRSTLTGYAPTGN